MENFTLYSTIHSSLHNVFFGLRKRSLFIYSFVIVLLPGLSGAFNSLHAQYSYAVINTYAGKGAPRSVVSQGKIAMDAAGNLYYVERLSNIVIKISSGTNTPTIIAGTGVLGFSGDGGPAIAATLNHPEGVAVDGAGNIIIADAASYRIRKINAATGIITTIAGTGVNGSGGDGGPAAMATLGAIFGMAFDGSGNLYLTDRQANKIRRVDGVTGIITTVAGTGANGYGGDGGPATSAKLSQPEDVTVDAIGNLFITDKGNSRIRKVTAATGVVSTVVGTGVAAFWGDGGPALSAYLNNPVSTAVDAAGNLYIADQSNHRIRKVAAGTSIIKTIAGTGVAGAGGDGGPGVTATIFTTDGIVCDPAGNVFFTQTQYQRIRKINPVTGIISSVYNPNIASRGDGGPALNAQLYGPRDVELDPSGNVYIADGVDQRVRKVDLASNIILTVAGNGTIGFSGDGGPAINAAFNDPAGLACDPAGNLFIADRYNNRIRRVDAVTGIITTVAGSGPRGFSGFGGPATSAEIDRPQDVVIDAAGDLYISSSYNNAIFKVTKLTGVITIVAGTGVAGFKGDGGLATLARLNAPHGLLFDAAGNLIFCDKGNHRIREVNKATGIITTIAGTGNPGIANDGGLATAAELYFPDDISLDPTGNIVIADLGNNRMRLLDMSNGHLYTVAGTGTPGFSGDGGLALNAQLNSASGMAITASGVTYVADGNNYRIRTFTSPLIPVALAPLTFEIHKNGSNAELNWSTANEVNTEFFIVQRSANGQSGWEDLGALAAAGNSIASRNYKFTDKQVLNGANFYRIRQTALDGKSNYSKIVSVQFAENLDIQASVYPNPFINGFKINLNSRTNSSLNVQIINLAGQLQVQRNVRISAGNNTIVMDDTGELKAGTYLLWIRGDNLNFVQKLVRR